MIKCFSKRIIRDIKKKKKNGNYESSENYDRKLEATILKCEKVLVSL